MLTIWGYQSATSATTAAQQTQGSNNPGTQQASNQAANIADAAAATASAFSAEKATCCDGDNWKSTLTGDASDPDSQVAKCQALGDEASVCDPQ